jgi:hypothetical protein
MNKCKQCGSYAINDHLHGREKGKDLDLCDVCYWRKKYFEVSTDILPLLNPWRDAENEKPESNENVLCNTKDLDGKPLYQVGYYIEGYGWYLEHDLTVIAWMHIPKNEGEE